MNPNRLRSIVRDSKKTANYESRAALRRQGRVNQIVNQIAHGLGETTSEAAATDALIDRYYSPEEIPSPDVLTEMFGDVPATPGKLTIMGASLLVILVLLFISR